MSTFPNAPASHSALFDNAPAVFVSRGWHEGVPDVGRVVWVLEYERLVLAVWDGRQWRSKDGRQLMGITQWISQ